jgi:hypothetical protein
MAGGFVPPGRSPAANVRQIKASAAVGRQGVGALTGVALDRAGNPQDVDEATAAGALALGSLFGGLSTESASP